MIEVAEADFAEFRKRKREESIDILRYSDDPEEAFVWYGNHEYLDFFINHVDIFRLRGFYEKGLFLALTMVNLAEITTYYPVGFLLSLLDQADREKLRACGDILTTKHPIEVFRGIRDGNNTRSIRRLSWTLKPETAGWFAMAVYSRDRLSGREPAVFRMKAP